MIGGKIDQQCHEQNSANWVSGKRLPQIGDSAVRIGHLQYQQNAVSDPTQKEREDDESKI